MVTISIHAPHARSDDEHKVQWVCTQISIHAPHARSDQLPRRPTSRARYFNPRSSCEERQADGTAEKSKGTFQSTLLMRGATCYDILHGCRRLKNISIHAPHARSDLREHRPFPVPACISIHAPHARSDGSASVFVSSLPDFNPRSSCEERPTKSQLSGLKGIFQSTLLMRGATLTVPMTIAPTIDFNPRSSCEERLRQVGTFQQFA